MKFVKVPLRVMLHSISSICVQITCTTLAGTWKLQTLLQNCSNYCELGITKEKCLRVCVGVILNLEISKWPLKQPTNLYVSFCFQEMLDSFNDNPMYFQKLSCKSEAHFSSYHMMCGEIHQKNLDFQQELIHLQQATLCSNIIYPYNKQDH
jgi:hypothetical protein